MLVLRRKVGESFTVRGVYRFTVESFVLGQSAVLRFENEEDSSSKRLHIGIGEHYEISDKLTLQIADFPEGTVRFGIIAPRDWPVKRVETN
jgi:sRNA-binding carbon storage regulator CsrA